MKHKKLRKKRLQNDSENSEFSENEDSDIPTPIDTDESFFELDLNELDKACAMHPKLYHEYAIQMPDARKALEEAEAELKIVKADIVKDIRDNPDKYDLKENPTEAAIKSVMDTMFAMPVYKKVQNKIITLQHRVNMLDAMLRSIDRKGDMIDNAVKLHGQDYFSPIRVSGRDAVGLHESKKMKARRKVDDN